MKCLKSKKANKEKHPEWGNGVYVDSNGKNNMKGNYYVPV